MKKKLAIINFAAVMSIGLLACGSAASTLTEEAEPEQEIQSTEALSEENEKNVTEDVTTNQGLENEEPEIIEQEEVIPTWYMDSEGIKSDKLGAVIKKDNPDLDKDSFGFFINIGRGSQHVFRCTYYEGDLDSYIAEHDGMQKDSRGEINYAFDEEPNGHKDLVIVGNGILISASVGSDEYINAYLNLIKSYEEASADSLAYITQDGLYCPALGINISCNESKNTIGSIGVRGIFDNGVDAQFNISDESQTANGIMYYMYETSNAQEVVDKYVDGLLEPNEYQTVEYTAIEGTAERNIGKYQYLGRGVNNITWNEQEWLFYSDETNWSVSITCDEGANYEDYISVIEKME